MRAEVLGELRILSAEGREPVPSGVAGRLLRWLLLRPNEAHGHDLLCRRLWSDADLDGRLSRDRLYVVVSRVRRFLDRDRDEVGLRLVTEPDGYRLDASLEALDSVAFEVLARQALGGDTEKAAQALLLWRGDPYGGFPFSDEVERQRVKLLGLRRDVERVADPQPTLAVRQLFARTKVLPPGLGSTSLAVRRRLLDQMGHAGETSLVVLTAPAGYGKSVLLAQWAEVQAGPVAWVTLEDSDNDPIRFWSAVQQSLAEAGVIGATAMPLDAAPGSQRFFGHLAEAIAAVAAPVGLVLDDVHHLTNRALHQGLEACLEHLPDRLTVAVAARPPLPFEPGDRMEPDRLRTLTASELRFDPAEVREVADSNGGGLDAKQLLEVTEGWPIAVSYLSRLGIHLTANQAWDGGTLRRYVVEEVLQELPADVHSFLLETAHLDRLSVGLCDTVTRRRDAARQIGWLRDNQLFLVEMGSEIGMYRYHHLVRDVLRERANADASFDVALRHQRAARWYRNQDLLEDALTHALAGGDDDTVAAVAGDVLWANINKGEVYTCRSWLHAIDPDVLSANRESHDLATLTAGGWLEPARRAAWAESRQRNYGDRDDLIVFCHEGHTAYLEGRAHDCVAINDEALAMVGPYFDRHPGRPGMRDILVGTLQMSKISGRILGGGLHHDDPELRDLALTSREGMPLMQLWLHGEWSFLAYTEGAHALAAELLDEALPHLASMDVTSTHLSAGRLLVSASLMESDRSDDPKVQRRIASRLRSMVDLYRTLRWDVELIPVLLALHVACHRAGDEDEAAARANEADVLLALCDDAPLLVAARGVLDMQATGGQGSDAEELTEREREVLEHLSEALTYDQIAERMDVSRHTVVGHVKATYRKLGVHSRHGALRRHRERRPGG